MRGAKVKPSRSANMVIDQHKATRDGFLDVLRPSQMFLAGQFVACNRFSRSSRCKVRSTAAGLADSLTLGFVSPSTMSIHTLLF